MKYLHVKNNFLFKKIAKRTAPIVFFLLFFAPVAYAESITPSYGDLGKILDAVGKNLTGVVYFLVACSYVVGVWFISSAINELRIYGQARTMMPISVAFTGPLTRLLVGTIMLFFPGFIDVSIYTLWNYSASYAATLRFDSVKTDTGYKIMNGIRVLVQTFGYVSVMRGMISISRAGRQQSQPGIVGKGMMHVIGGVLAINIVATVSVIKATLGLI